MSPFLHSNCEAFDVSATIFKVSPSTRFVSTKGVTNSGSIISLIKVNLAEESAMPKEFSAFTAIVPAN